MGHKQHSNRPTSPPALDKTFMRKRAQQTLMSTLAKRSIPEISSVMVTQQWRHNTSFRRKRRRMSTSVAGPAEGFADDGDLSSSEGEVGLEYNMEHDGWGNETEDGRAKWRGTWEAGLSASDDDSDGFGEWTKTADPCSEEELVSKRRAHLVKLKGLYESQYLRLKRLLGKKHLEYVQERETLLNEIAAAGGQPGRMRGASKIPLSKRKQLPEATASNVDDEDSARSLFHRYKKTFGSDAALALQLRRRKSTGLSYPFAAPTNSSTPGMRLQCTYHPAHLPPCYNRAMPFSKVCRVHVMEDKHQVLYKRCAFSEQVGPAKVSCPNPIHRSDQPPFCDTHIKLAEFVRNPRLSRPPPSPSSLLRGGGGHSHNMSSSYDGLSSPQGGLDFAGLEALVGDVPGIGMNVDDITSTAGALGLDGFGLGGSSWLSSPTGMMPAVPEDETKALAELQSSLQFYGTSNNDMGTLSPGNLNTDVTALIAGGDGNGSN